RNTIEQFKLSFEIYLDILSKPNSAERGADLHRLLFLMDHVLVFMQVPALEPLREKIKGVLENSRNKNVDERTLRCAFTSFLTMFYK
ncbi:unnamed protein product, partial [Caenorhabditis brenneri]